MGDRGRPIGYWVTGLYEPLDVVRGKSSGAEMHRASSVREARNWRGPLAVQAASEEEAQNDRSAEPSSASPRADPARARTRTRSLASARARGIDLIWSAWHPARNPSRQPVETFEAALRPALLGPKRRRCLLTAEMSSPPGVRSFNVWHLSPPLPVEPGEGTSTGSCRPPLLEVAADPQQLPR